MNPNDRISDRYVIIKKIGSGGMANVYLAKDLILERNVAIKLLAFDFVEDEENLRRFKREALSTTELVHQNIVSVYDVGEGETPYIVMEYVDGMDLNAYIKKNHPLPLPEVVRIMDQILDGMSYAHAHHVIHRDLKPHNILLNKQGEVKISDFGIAVALSKNSITQTNSLLGSVHYLSPEQARGSLVTKQSDIYALGILLFEMLTGQVPFDGESAVSIALKHFQNDLPLVTDYNKDIPQPLENVVLKATAKDPADRYPSISAMRADLKTALDADRANEARFVPAEVVDEQTRVLEPLSQAAVAKAAADADEKEPDTKDKSKKESKKKRKRSKRWLYSILFLIFILIGGASIFVLSRPAEVVVPDLRDLTYEEAVKELEEAELTFGEKIEDYSADVKENHVIKSNPKHGTTIRKNQKIDLHISLGPEHYELGDYYNQSYENVRAKLSEAGIKVIKEEVYSEEVDEERIVKQSHAPGEEVIPGKDEVTLSVSAGREGITLKDLTGYSREGVDQYIEENNLLATFEEMPSDDVVAGQVLSQMPEAGREIYAGDRITIVFSSGPEKEDEKTFSKKLKIPYVSKKDDETGEQLGNYIEIYIEDANHTLDQPVQTFDIYKEMEFSQSFVVVAGESAQYKIVRDGEVIDQGTVSP